MRSRRLPFILVGVALLLAVAFSLARDSWRGGGEQATATEPSTPTDTRSRGGEEASTTNDTVTGPQRLGAISFVYYRSVDDEPAVGVFTIDPDGRDLRLLVPDAERPTWSADGKLLAFSDRACGLSVRDVVRKATRQVVAKELANVCWPTGALSPNGEELAFGSYEPIRIVVVDGGTPTQLTSGESDEGLRWSPDGDRIAFLRELGEEVWIAEADSEVARRVLATDGNIYSGLSWSPDSRLLAFSSRLGESSNLPSTVRVLDVETGALSTPAPELEAQYGRPAWSPDGTRLALRDSNETYVVQLSSGAVRRVMVDDADTFDYSDVAWSPDGTRLLVPVEGELWVVRVDGAGKERLVGGGQDSVIEDVQWHRGALRSAALGGMPVTTLRPVVHVNALPDDTYSACGIELWQPEGSRWLVAGEGNTARGYAKPLRPGVWQILDGSRDVLGQAVVTNATRTRWNISDASGTLVGTAQGPDGPWIALVLLWGRADCFE